MVQPTNAIRGSKLADLRLQTCQTSSAMYGGLEMIASTIPIRLHSCKGAKRPPSFHIILSLTSCLAPRYLVQQPTHPRTIQGKNSALLKIVANVTATQPEPVPTSTRTAPSTKNPPSLENLLNKEFGLRPRNRHRRIHMKVEATKFLCPQDVLERFAPIRLDMTDSARASFPDTAWSLRLVNSWCFIPNA